MPIEEYELLDQEPRDLELQQSSPPESASTPSPYNEVEEEPELRDSLQSDSSQLFDDIDVYMSRNSAEIDDFSNSPLFQSVFLKYQGANVWMKRVCMGLCIFSILLWLAGLLVYSQMSLSSAVKSITWQTDVEVSGKNITLNKYSPKYANLTIDQMRKSKYAAYKTTIKWLEPQQYPKDTAPVPRGSGFYLERDSDRYNIRQMNTVFTAPFIERTQFAYRNNFFYITDVILNPHKPIDDPDNYHIVVTDKLEQWRSLSFALYWIYNPLTAQYIPIQPPQNLKKLQNDNQLQEEILDKLHFAEFSPKGDFVVFGFNHDIFLQDVVSNEIQRITNTGSTSIFNGKPDWVYEEEVAADYKLIWWSPDQENLVFASLNDTLVQEFELDYYIKDSTEVGTQYKELLENKFEDVNQYPIKTSIKYPKPGTSNPILSLFNYRLSDKSIKEITKLQDGLGEDFILYKAAWVDSKNFLMKLTDRTSAILKKKVFQPAISSEVIEVNSMNVTQEYGGWVDKLSQIAIVETDDDKENLYIDKVVVNGFTHIALFESATSKDYARLLTSSNTWEVPLSSPLVHDKQFNVVYFLTTIRSSMDAHLYAVDLSTDDNKLIPITSSEVDGLYQVEFDQAGQHLNLFYKGPKQPWQRLVNMAEVHEFISSGDFKGNGVDELILKSEVINHFDVTEGNLKDTNIPTKVYKTIQVGKYDDGSPLRLNVIEIFPPNFNPHRAKKYPLLVYAYGGPGSQTVDKSFDIDFQHIASASLDALVLVIDPRGTGGQGWKFSSTAKNRLGYWEPRDITTITSEYITVNKKFIDQSRTAIWGWSYGGFTSLKTLEFDRGKTFKYGMAVAPVTNWLFYDSVYTERYMNPPKVNGNYEKYGRISDYKNFKSLKRFLLMHGTSDDNVHLQNLLWLLDKFNLGEVENYDVHFFPDSDHGIYYHNANSIVFDKLLHWLRDAFMGKFDGLYR